MPSQRVRMIDMAESQRSDIVVVTERFERRLAEECGKVRVDIANGFGAQRAESAALRAEMIDRNAELLKWHLVFDATVVATIIAGVAAMAMFLR